MYIIELNYNTGGHQMKLEEVFQSLQKIQNELDRLKDRHGSFPDEFDFDLDDVEERYKSDNAGYILELLKDASNRMEWVNKPVKAEGYLAERSDGRYGIDGTEIYFTSGSRIDVWRYDEFDERYDWFYTTVEHNGEDYYIEVFGRDILIEGAKVRAR